MSIKIRKKNIFCEVQQHIYNSLLKNEKLHQNLQIFSQVPKNTDFPYLYLGKFTVINRSVKESIKMYFVNEIRLYSNKNSSLEMLNWFAEIKDTLCGYNIQIGKCHINEISFLQMNFETMPESKINYINGKFRIIVEENNDDIQRIFNAA